MTYCQTLPFGDALSCNTVPPLDFTGQMLDPETDLTHFLCRQYSTGQGSWTIPDPTGIAAVNPSNPQSWNPYVYVLDNPCDAD